MGLAMRHGVLFYEAMGLNNRISDLRFGVLFYGSLPHLRINGVGKEVPRL